MKETEDLIMWESQMYILYLNVVPGYELRSLHPQGKEQFLQLYWW